MLRGADRNVDVHIRNPDGSILTSHLWTKEGTTDREVNTQGDYRSLHVLACQIGDLRKYARWSNNTIFFIGLHSPGVSHQQFLYVFLI